MCDHLPYYGGAPTRGAGDAHVTLDVAGTFDPTPVSDSLNALLYGLEGDVPNAFISLAAAFAPFAVDTLKLGRPALKAGGAAADAVGGASSGATIAKRQPQASDPIGSSSLPLNGGYREHDLQRGQRNDPTTINDRFYSGHALDRMQERGIMPSVVEEAIARGRSRSDPNYVDRIQYYDPVNKIRVIVSDKGNVISVMKDSAGF